MRHSARRRWTGGRGAILLAVCAVCLGALLAGCGSASTTTRTLAADGGMRITLRASCLPTSPGCDLSKQRDAAIPVLTRRLSGAVGVTDPTVHADGAANIVVELPGATSDASVMPLLTSIGTLTFLDTYGVGLGVGSSTAGETCTTACQPGQFQIVFTGDQLDPNSINATNDPQTNRPVVLFEFASANRDRFAQYTRDHISQYLTIAFNDAVVESAVIQGEIDGQGEISGIATLSDAQSLATILKSGALPVALSVEGEQRVTPTAQ